MSKTVVKGLAVTASGGGISDPCSATLTITANTVDSTTFGEANGHDEVTLYVTKELSLEGYSGSLTTGDGVSWAFAGGGLSESGTGTVTSCSASADPGSLMKLSCTIRSFEASGGSTPNKAPAQQG